MARETLGTLRTIYPSNRSITIEETIQWAHDNMCDDAVKEWVANNQPLPAGIEQDEAVYLSIAKGVNRPTLLEAVEYLEDHGKATFATWTRARVRERG